MAITNNVEQIWDSLGTFWSRFEDKPTVTELWKSYFTVSNHLLRNNFKLRLSKSLTYMPEIFEYKYESLYITLSGIGENIASEGASVSGLSENEVAYKLPYDHVSSIPTMTNLTNDATLTEGTDYRIAQRKFLVFDKTSMVLDPADQPISYTAKLHAETINTYNLILWNIWAENVGLTLTDFENNEYLPYDNGYAQQSSSEQTVTKAKHFKYLIWGLTYLKAMSNTIQTLKNGVGISAGIPFVQRSGTVTDITGRLVTVSVSGVETPETDIYKVPGADSNIPLTVGQDVTSFDLLSDGLDVFDYVNKPQFIDSLATSDFDKRTIVVFNRQPSLSGMAYKEDFYKDFAKSSVPDSFRTFFTEYYSSPVGVSNTKAIERAYPMTFSGLTDPDYLYFNNSNLPDIFKTSFTIGAWIRPDFRKLDNNQNWGHLQRSCILGLGLVEPSGNMSWISFYLNGGPGNQGNNGHHTLTCEYYVGASQEIKWNLIQSQGSLIDHQSGPNAWMYVTLVADLDGTDKYMRMYRNGMPLPVHNLNNFDPFYSFSHQADLVSDTDPTKFSIPSSEGLNIGIGNMNHKLNGGSVDHTYDRFQGSIDEVSIWTKALSSAEVMSLYNGGLPLDLSTNSHRYISSSQLKAWIRFEEGSGTSLTDSSGNGYHATINNGNTSDLTFTSSIPESVL